jgi:hypothetical protein
MSESSSRSWSEAVQALRQAVGDLKSALARYETDTAGEEASASRLKQNLGRVQQAGAELQTTLVNSFERHKPEVVSGIDRERAERTAQNLKSSFDELASLAGDVAADVAVAARSTLKDAEPEIRAAIRSLEVLASSATAWISESIESSRASRGDAGGKGRQPLDDL